MRIAITPSMDELKVDLTRNLAEPAIASQVVLSCAIIMTSIPVLNRFLDQFETGMLRIHEDQAMCTSAHSSSNPAESHRMSNLASSTRSTFTKQQRFTTSIWEADEQTESRNQPGPVTRDNGTVKAWRQSRSSDTRGILMSRSWDCHYEQPEERSLDDERPAFAS